MVPSCHTDRQGCTAQCPHHRGNFPRGNRGSDELVGAWGASGLPGGDLLLGNFAGDAWASSRVFQDFESFPAI